MALFEQFPYLNFHELNTDWLIKVVNDWAKKYDSFETALKMLETDFDDLKKYVEDYFDNTDFKNLVSEKLEEMLANGELDNILGNLLNIARSYDTKADLENSDAPIGTYVIYDSAIYKIVENDNGYGIETTTGYAITDFSTKQIFSYDMEKALRWNLFNLSGGGWSVQGSAYSEELEKFAYFFRNNDASNNKIVFVDAQTGGISEASLPNCIGNDITYVNNLGWIVVNDYIDINVPNFLVLDNSGNIIDTINSVSDNWKMANISYDKKHNRLVSFVQTFTVIMTPEIVDGAFKLLATIPCPNASETMPNDNPYTARQGSFCDDNGNFFMISSIFFNDALRKPMVRISQISTYTGYVIATNDVIYNYNGTEAESGFIYKDKLYINGYWNNAISQLIMDRGEIAIKPSQRLTSIIYFDATNGKIINDGFTPDKPVSDLWLACSIAGSFEQSIVYMISDEPSANAGEISPIFKKTLIITSADNNKKNIYSRFWINNNAGYFEIQYAILNQADTNKCITVHSSNMQIVLYNTEINGSGNNQGKYIILMDDGGQCSLRQIVARNCYALANVARGVYFSASDLAGNNCNRVIDADEGAIACIDTVYRTFTGFTNIGEQFGGVIMQGATGVIPAP